MDPLTISTACITIVGTASTIVTTLATWINTVKGMEDTVRELSHELNQLKGLAKSLEGCLANADVATAIQSIDLAEPASNSSVWISIRAIVVDCRSTTQQYHDLVMKVDKAGDRARAIKKLLQDFQMTTKSSSWVRLRARLQTIYPALSALVAMVALTTQVTSFHEQQQAHETTQQLVERLGAGQQTQLTELHSKIDLLLLQQAAMRESVNADHEDSGLSDDLGSVELHSNIFRGLQGSQRIVSTIASTSQISGSLASYVLSGDIRSIGTETSSRLLALRPEDYELLLDPADDTAQSVRGPGLDVGAQQSISAWIPPKSSTGMGADFSRTFAKSLIAQYRQESDEGNWKRAAMSLDTCLTKYADFIDEAIDDDTPSSATSTLSTLRIRLGLAKHMSQDYHGCVAEIQPLLAELVAEHEADRLRSLLSPLARACYYTDRLNDAERYCHQALNLDGESKKGTWLWYQTIQTLIMVLDAQQRFAESEVWCGILHDEMDYEPRPQVLAVADLWYKHVLVRQLWNAGDKKRAVESGLRFIRQYLEQSIEHKRIDKHTMGITDNLSIYGSMGLAATGRGYSFLHLLVSDENHGRWREVAMLLREGADVNTRTFYSRWTPLHSFATWAPVRSVAPELWPAQLLLEAPGVDIEAVNDAGDSPIVIAAMRDDVGTVSMLLQSGASPYFTRREGWDASSEKVSLGEGRHHLLTLAVREGQLETVRRHLERRTARCLQLESAIIACQAGYDEILSLFVALDQIEPDSTDAHGNTLLTIALRSRRRALYGGQEATVLVLLRWLQQHGKPVNPSCMEGFSALDLTTLAVFPKARDWILAVLPSNSRELMPYLSSSPPDPGACPHPLSLLRRAARAADPGALELAILAGWNVDTHFNTDDSFLLSSAKFGRSQNVRILLKAGADPNFSDSAGRYVLDYVETSLSCSPRDRCKRHLEECRVMLLAAGARSWFGPDSNPQTCDWLFDRREGDDPEFSQYLLKNLIFKPGTMRQRFSADAKAVP